LEVKEVNLIKYVKKNILKIMQSIKNDNLNIWYQQWLKKKKIKRSKFPCTYK